MSLLFRLDRLSPAFLYAWSVSFPGLMSATERYCMFHLTKATLRWISVDQLLSGKNFFKRRHLCRPGLAFMLGLPGIFEPEG